MASPPTIEETQRWLIFTVLMHIGEWFGSSSTMLHPANENYGPERFSSGASGYPDGAED